MTVPESKLTLHLDPRHMTLGEVVLFSPDGFDALRLSKFLVKHGNWTAAEIDEIEVGELEEVSAQIVDQLKAVSLPLASEPRSKSGRGSSRKRHPTGQAT
jgi:hypothetical protein